MLRFAQHDWPRNPLPCHAERSEAESKHLLPEMPMCNISQYNEVLSKCLLRTQAPVPFLVI